MKCIDYFMKNRRVGQFGIKYLDDRLRGINQGDLILIGARSGAGKSTLADMIAQCNVKLGKKVHLFSLENFDGDSFVTKAYYFYKNITKDYDLDLRDFACGEFNIKNEALIEAEKKANECFKGINLTPRQADYNIEKLIDDMKKAVEKEGCELIILDHLDYVDKDNPNENDISHMTHLMRAIRNLQDVYKVAVVAFSHLRKPMNAKELPAVPSMDEFIGSSNKVKEATVVIMVAPDDKSNEDNYDKQRKATWFCVRKCRMGGIDNKTAKLFFDRRLGKYADDYEIYVVDYAGKKQEKIV